MTRNLDIISRWLGAKVPGANFDEAGTATIASGPDKHLILELSATGEICHFCAVVGPLNEESPVDSLIAALALNRFGKPLGGCWLAWEPDLQMLTLCWNLEIASADELAFVNAIDNFMTALDTARSELLAKGEENAPKAEAWLETA